MCLAHKRKIGSIYCRLECSAAPLTHERWWSYANTTGVDSLSARTSEGLSAPWRPQIPIPHSPSMNGIANRHHPENPAHILGGSFCHRAKLSLFRVPNSGSVFAKPHLALSYNTETSISMIFVQSFLLNRQPSYLFIMKTL